jgi:hypothetical protein
MQQRAQRPDGDIAARGTLIDAGGTGGERFGIGTAARVAALRALRLRQARVDTFDERRRRVGGYRHGVTVSPCSARPAMTRPDAQRDAVAVLIFRLPGTVGPTYHEAVRDQARRRLCIPKHVRHLPEENK